MIPVPNAYDALCPTVPCNVIQIGITPIATFVIERLAKTQVKVNA